MSLSTLTEAELSLASYGQTYNELCEQLGIVNSETRRMADVFDGYVSSEDGDYE